MRSSRASRTAAHRRICGRAVETTSRREHDAPVCAHHQLRRNVPDDNDDLRWYRQRLARLRERRLELRHDEDQQHHHRRHRDEDQYRRIDQRRAAPISRSSLLRSIVSASRCSTVAERAAGLAGAHDVHVEPRKNFAPRIERLRQRLAAAHVVANALQQRGDRRRRRKADQDLERAIERQARAQQRRQLARDAEHVVPRHASRCEPSAARAGFDGRSPAAAAPSACAICIGIKPWSRRRSTISRLVGRLELAARYVAGRVNRAVADRVASAGAVSLSPSCRASREHFLERRRRPQAPCAARPRTS